MGSEVRTEHGLRGSSHGLVVLAHLDAAGLAAPTRVHLGLYHPQ